MVNTNSQDSITQKFGKRKECCANLSYSRVLQRFFAEKVMYSEETMLKLNKQVVFLNA